MISLKPTITIYTILFSCLLLFSCNNDTTQTLEKKVITEAELSILIKKKDYTLVYFWTTWCGPCRKTLSKTLPVLEAKLDSSKVQLIVVAVSKDEKKIDEIITQSKLRSSNFRLEFTGPDIYLIHKIVLKNILENLFPHDIVWRNSVPVFTLVNKDHKVIIPHISTHLDKALKLFEKDSFHPIL
jgi:thiol-disulfide isomerase/thioredoxin